MQPMHHATLKPILIAAQNMVHGIHEQWHIVSLFFFNIIDGYFDSCHTIVGAGIESRPRSSKYKQALLAIIEKMRRQSNNNEEAVCKLDAEPTSLLFLQ
jgi:hypothetical protein